MSNTATFKYDENKIRLLIRQFWTRNDWEQPVYGVVTRSICTSNKIVCCSNNVVNNFWEKTWCFQINNNNEMNLTSVWKVASFSHEEINWRLVEFTDFKTKPRVVSKTTDRVKKSILAKEIPLRLTMVLLTLTVWLSLGGFLLNQKPCFFSQIKGKPLSLKKFARY